MREKAHRRRVSAERFRREGIYVMYYHRLSITVLDPVFPPGVDPFDGPFLTAHPAGAAFETAGKLHRDLVRLTVIFVQVAGADMETIPGGAFRPADSVINPDVTLLVRLERINSEFFVDPHIYRTSELPQIVEVLQPLETQHARVLGLLPNGFAYILLRTFPEPHGILYKPRELFGIE